MTKLIVTPIDMAAPGSFRQRKRMFGVLADLEKARKAKSVVAMTVAMQSIEELVRDYLETDDGTTIEDALEMCSADEFDRLIAGLLNGETVPN